MMLIKLPGRLKIPVMILMIAKIMVISRAHDLPDHKPHVIMNPTTASMSKTIPIPVRNVVVKASIDALVNGEAKGICSRISTNSSSGIRSQPPAARNVLSKSRAAPPNNERKLTMPCKIANTVIPTGRERL